MQPNDKIGPYILISKLGKGGMGEVWLAEKESSIIPTKFAAKIAFDEFSDIEELKQEASVWAKVSGHPNVLPIVEANIYDGQALIVSEYVSEGSLADWLLRNGGKTLNIELTVRIIQHILAGLDHIHSTSVIHRDLKPENILMQGGIPRITDFGISRTLRVTNHTLTVKGSLSYMSPEALYGERSIQTDIWSVGVIFYKLLSGRLPFSSSGFAVVPEIQNSSPIPLPSHIPVEIARIVEKCLEKTPVNRFQSAEEMSKSLSSVISSISISTLEGETEEITFVKQNDEIDTVNLLNRIKKSSFFLEKSFKLDYLITDFSLHPDNNILTIATSDGIASIEITNSEQINWLQMQKSEWKRGNSSHFIEISAQGNEILFDESYEQTGPSFTKAFLLDFSDFAKLNIWDYSQRKQAKTFSYLVWEKLGHEAFTIRDWSPESNSILSFCYSKKHFPEITEDIFSDYIVTKSEGVDKSTYDKSSVISLWNTKTGLEFQRVYFRNFERMARSMKFFKDGGKILFGCNDGYLRVWSVKESKLLAEIKSGQNPIYSVSINNKLPILSLCEFKGVEVKNEVFSVWDLNTKKKLREFKHKGEIEKTLISPRGNKIVSIGSNKCLIWDLQNGRVENELDANIAKFSHNGEFLLLGKDKEVTLKRVY